MLKAKPRPTPVERERARRIVQQARDDTAFGDRRHFYERVADRIADALAADRAAQEPKQ